MLERRAGRVVVRWMVGLALVLAGLVPGSAGAQESSSWLDQALVRWNEPGMAIPKAPPTSNFPTNDPACIDLNRPAELPEDQAVLQAGWTLTGIYQSGWGITAITARTGQTGMCRATGVQTFVFSDGIFVGTISPDTMEPRPDGVGQIRSLGRDAVYVAFEHRYMTLDANCCPSGPSTGVQYSITRGDAGPMLIAMSVQKLGGSAPVQAVEPPAPATPELSATHEGLTVTVLKVERGWKSSSRRPPDGKEYLTVELKIDNGTAQQLTHNPTQFSAVTVDGIRWSRGNERDPYLRSGVVLPGVPVRGWISFEMPIGAQVIHILWEPTYNKAYPLAV